MTKTATETIARSYLMWIGSEHYKDIAAYSDEAITLGVSKRLPSVAAAKALTEPGSVIFVVHDEGETTECPECYGELECPECRKRAFQIERLSEVIADIKARFDDFDSEASAGAKRSVKVRLARQARLAEDTAKCPICAGEKSYQGGTGGYVVLKDGSKMDHRQYNYWLHQPGRFDDSTVVERHQCEHCGGKGTKPCAKVFGMFVPDRVEYILTGDESNELIDELKKHRVTLVPGSVLKTETKRGCGYRHTGGYYAVTSPEGTTKAVKSQVDKLIKSGVVKPDGVELHGSFVRFVTPVEIDSKRFRGVKTWALDARVEAEAEMIKEALEE